MIAAKGGSEKLDQVNDLVVRMHTDCPNDEALFLKLFIWTKTDTETFWVFPDRFYDAALYAAKDPGNANFQFFNGEAGKFWSFFVGSGPPHEWSNKFEIDRARGRLLFAQIVYLGQTRWAKPVPVGYSRQRIHLRVVDLVRTRFGDISADFYLDRQTHLPLKVETNLSFGGQILQSSQGYMLSDYTSVSGIRLPLKMTAGLCRAQLRYEVNASYDPLFFERPPRGQYEPEPWRVVSSGSGKH